MRSAADFSDTTRRGAKASRGSVVVYALAADPVRECPAVVGLVVAKTVGNSVVRHRTSRRIRAAIAPLVDGLPPGARVVVRALPGADVDPTLASSVAIALGAALEKAG